MNEQLKMIFSRRSIRKYRDKPIDEPLIHELMEAAMAAPSACAKDPWHFIIVRDIQLLNRLSEGLPHGHMLAQAPLGIAVCGDLYRAHDSQISYLLQDCSAAIENILLAAAGLSLGACWLGVHPREDRIAHMRTVLNIPDYIVPVSVIAVGYPDEDKSPRTRCREEAMHWEGW